LQPRGYDVTLATTATEALDLAERLHFDLVVLDILLHDVDGFELLDTLKHKHPNLAVLVLTGMGIEEDLLETARLKHADGFLTKGLPPSELVIEIHRILRRRDSA
jgi:DNA-binding response OmpR family regulator